MSTPYRKSQKPKFQSITMTSWLNLEQIDSNSINISFRVQHTFRFRSSNHSKKCHSLKWIYHALREAKIQLFYANEN